MPRLQIVSPGEVISESSGDFLKGHGTYEMDGKIISCICGVVENIGKLISVRPLRSRYIPHVGDVVVGRITQVSVKRWLVDLQARKQGSLLLSSINLQGHDNQRRKTFEDQLNMRNMFVEDDLIVSEVQTVQQRDGVASLQTRSSRYGKLQDGLMIAVDASLVKQCKQHFVEFDFGVEIILGKNGYIFISSKKGDREAISRIRNSIYALANEYIPVYPDTILDVYEMSKSLHPRDMVLMENMKLITKSAYERVHEEVEFNE